MPVTCLKKRQLEGGKELGKAAIHSSHLSICLYQPHIQSAFNSVFSSSSFFYFFFFFFFFLIYKYNEKTKANYYKMGIKIYALVNFTSYQTSKKLNNEMYNENIDT
jgi:hypothetical protein